MIIGNRYNDNKLYRGLKHYDSLPLTSNDVHEYADTEYMKRKLLTENIVGSGTLNAPACSISNAGITMSAPTAVLIEGDIALIKSSGTAPIVTTSTIQSSGVVNGLLCIVGWYQALDAASTLREYGGVNNNIMPNDIIDPALKIQVSTRYQLRWDTIIVPEIAYDHPTEPLKFNLVARDATGKVTQGTIPITTIANIDHMKKAKAPATMDYAVSELFIVPILKFTYSASTISSATAYSALSGAGTLVLSENSTPSGTYDDGTILYNKVTRELSIYIGGVGFVPTYTEVSLLQYVTTVVIDKDYTTATNITLNIGIANYSSTDIVEVSYNGAMLTYTTQYTVDTVAKTVTLVGFTTRANDIVTIKLLKLSRVNYGDSVSNQMSMHINAVGTDSSLGHVQLSDTPNNNLGVGAHIAATPKALYDAMILTDTATSKKYKLTVTNGVLGITVV